MDKALQREKTRERVRKHRALQRSVTETADNVTQSPDSVTEGIDNVTLGVTHPVMKYLIKEERVDDKPTNREKMEGIVRKLGDHRQLSNVYFGCGKYSLPMDAVGELLEITT